ncbi:AAC(3) family N-acetyltransferase [Solidesulfovibrio sp.]
MSLDIEDILRRLELPRCRYYYLHLSLDGLGLSLRDYVPLVEILKSRLVNASTLVVPSFSFGNNVQYAALLDTRELCYDLDLTPCRVNLFGELFRRMPGVVRTWHPLFPVACLGQDAPSLRETCHLDSMPFDKNTIFGRLTNESSCVIGLGVDANTNSFAHMADDQFAANFPYPIYTEHPLWCETKRRGDKLHSGNYHAITVELRKKIKPLLLQQQLFGQDFFRAINTPVNAYRLEIAPFVSFMTRLARDAFERRRLPIWHIQ